MKHFLPLLAILALHASRAQTCDTASVVNYQIRASDTDPNIAWELAKHYAWYNPTCTPNGTLLVHLVGSLDNPLNTTYFPKLAANNGFHVVSLKYPNGTSAQNPCRNSTDTNCYENFRREIIEGIDHSPDISVDTTNCIYNRLIKLLEYLHGQNPSEGWDAYYSGSTVQWSDVMISGHSQGGGHAAVIAMDHPLKRVITFASPNDYSAYFNDGAPWTTKPHITPDSAYYAFGNLYDDIVDFYEQHLQWGYLGLQTFGDTVHVRTTSCPYEYSHQLYNTDTASGLSSNHNNTVRDMDVPLDSAGVPIYEPVWKYLLGLPCATASLESHASRPAVHLYPNPFTHQATLNLENIHCKSCTLDILNPTGQVVRSMENIRTDKVVISPGALAEGIYYYQLRDEGRAVYTGKMVLKR